MKKFLNFLITLFITLIFASAGFFGMYWFSRFLSSGSGEYGLAVIIYGPIFIIVGLIVGLKVGIKISRKLKIK